MPPSLLHLGIAALWAGSALVHADSNAPAADLKNTPPAITPDIGLVRQALGLPLAASIVTPVGTTSVAPLTETAPVPATVLDEVAAMAPATLAHAMRHPTARDVEKTRLADVADNGGKNISRAKESDTRPVMARYESDAEASGTKLDVREVLGMLTTQSAQTTRESVQPAQSVQASAATSTPPLSPVSPQPPSLPEPFHGRLTPALAQREPAIATPSPPVPELMDNQPPRQPPVLQMTDSLPETTMSASVTGDQENAHSAMSALPDQSAVADRFEEMENEDDSLIVRTMKRQHEQRQAEVLARQEVRDAPAVQSAQGMQAATTQQPAHGLQTASALQPAQVMQADPAVQSIQPAEEGEEGVSIHAVALPQVETLHLQAALSTDSRAVLFGEQTLLAASDSKLDRLRGGFDAGNGLQVSFGITRVAYINGNLATTSSFNIADVSKISADQASALGKQMASVNLVQNGPGNLYQANQGNGTAAGTVIQNTLNNQNIATRTIIDASANSAGILRSMNLQRTLTEALGSNLRR